MRKKRFFKTSVIILLIITSIMLASCANTGDNFNFEPVVDTNYSYNEADFAASIAASKQNNVAFATEGALLFDKIIYPAEIDNLQKDENDVLLKSERYKKELKDSVNFFASVLKKMTGDDIVCEAASDIQAQNAILLNLDSALAPETKGQGYKLSVAQNQIAISSDTYQGISNGIYSFLEDKLGCMFLANGVDYIPSLKTINLASEEFVDVPDIMWRSVYAYDSNRMEKAMDDGFGWNTKVRLNGAGFDDWYNWCHTSFVYIKPDEYFEEHPEYFSLYNGKRCYEQGPVSGQLCWTNEDVYKIISEKVLTEMAENPDQHIWDVSQMDTWISRGVGCQCENCKKIDDAEQSPMGSLLTFINRLADEVNEKFPQNYISTLAYNYSEKVPKTLRPKDNVIIKLCLMPGDNASTLKNPTSKDGERAKAVVEEWGKAAKNVLIWDYNVNFHNYLMPYPSLGTITDNHKFYIENNTYGIFHQMDYDKGGVDSELTTYLYAKSMWDSNVNTAQLASKYMSVYYGAASSKMSEYYNEIHKDVAISGAKMYIYDTPTVTASKYFNSKNIEKYFKIFEQAEAAANGNEVVLSRIKRAKVGVLYMRASVFSFDFKARKQALEELYDICKDNEITALKEGEPDGLDKFYKAKMLEINATPAIIAAIVIGVLLIIGAVVMVVYFVQKRKKKLTQNCEQ